MKQNVVLISTSLLSILLTAIHVADDVARGFERGGVAIFVGVPILVVWLYGTLVLADRRSGCVIVLLGSLLGTVAPIVHVRGTHGIVGGESAQFSGAFFFAWTLIALGVTALFSLVLSARELWRLGRGQAR